MELCAGYRDHSVEKKKSGACPPRAYSLIETLTITDGTTVPPKSSMMGGIQGLPGAFRQCAFPSL